MFVIAGMERQPRDGVQEQRLAEGRPGTRPALEPHRRFHVHERQRHELREASRPLLLRARPQQVASPVLGRLDVPEHDRHVRAQADAVRGCVHGEPLVGRDLVRADHRAHLVVQDLGGGPGKRAEAERAKPLQVLLERKPECLGSLPHLERGEGVDVQLGQLGPDRLDHRGVVVAREGRVDAALEADLGRASIPGLARPPDDLVERDEVGRATQVRRQPALREGAEAAAEVADVRVLDVPGDDVADLVAAHLAPQPVGRREHALALLAAGLEEADELLLPELGGVDRERVPANDERDAAQLAGVPAVLAGEPERVGRTQRRRQDGRIDPRRRRGSAGTPAGAARARARATRRLGEPVAVGPWRLGVHVVDRHGRDAAPVVDAGVEKARKVVVGEVRRRLDGDVVRQQQPCHRDRPEVVVEARLGVRGHARARLGTEVLDDHLLEVAVPLVQGSQLLERSDPLGAGLADPDQDPAREGNPQLAGEVDRLQPARRLLVRRGPVRTAPRREPLGCRLEHDPHRRRDRPQRDEILPAHHARVQVRQQTRSPRARASRPGRGTRASSRSRAPRARRARPCSGARACRRA